MIALPGARFLFSGVAASAAPSSTVFRYVKNTAELLAAIAAADGVTPTVIGLYPAAYTLNDTIPKNQLWIVGVDRTACILTTGGNNVFRNAAVSSQVWGLSNLTLYNPGGQCIDMEGVRNEFDFSLRNVTMISSGTGLVYRNDGTKPNAKFVMEDCFCQSTGSRALLFENPAKGDPLNRQTSIKRSTLLGATVGVMVSGPGGANYNILTLDDGCVVDNVASITNASSFVLNNCIITRSTATVIHDVPQNISLRNCTIQPSDNNDIWLWTSASVVGSYIELLNCVIVHQNLKAIVRTTRAVTVRVHGLRSQACQFFFDTNAATGVYRLEQCTMYVAGAGNKAINTNGNLATLNLVNFTSDGILDAAATLPVTNVNVNLTAII